MIIPRFNIGDQVFVYKSGRLVPVIIEKINIVLSENKSTVGYQFHNDDNNWLFLRFHFTDESEVFESIEEFAALSLQQ